MANSGPNTNGEARLLTTVSSIQEPMGDTRSAGSQFFLTLAPTPYLDNKHTIFGRVSSGIRVLQRLGAVATDAQDRSVTLTALKSFLSFFSHMSTGPLKTSKSTKRVWCNPHVGESPRTYSP